MIVDAHLDLGYNAIRGRDVLRPSAEQKPDEQGTPSVGLPDLRAGGVGLVCATIFTEPATCEHFPQGYRTADEAHAQGRRQLDWYRRQEGEGHLRIVRAASDLPERFDAAAPLPAIILLEGADPIRSPGEVEQWHADGVRIVGLAWHRTRHAGGTGEPGPLTTEGIALVRAMDKARMIHDTSHLAEESFHQLADQSDGPLIASHSNCRALVPGDRQLSDAMIRVIVQRGGVIGINLFAKFLLSPAKLQRRPATLEDVTAHIRHVCDLAGAADHVGLGTDMDGGFGRESLPRGIESSADLPRLAECLADAGFADDAVAAIMGENWLRVFKSRLG